MADRGDRASNVMTARPKTTAMPLPAEPPLNRLATVFWKRAISVVAARMDEEDVAAAAPKQRVARVPLRHLQQQGAAP